MSCIVRFYIFLLQYHDAKKDTGITKTQSSHHIGSKASLPYKLFVDGSLSTSHPASKKKIAMDGFRNKRNTGCIPPLPPFMDKTMEVVRRILDQNKNPQFAADVDHKYDDKYGLVEFMTHTGIAATLNVFEQLDGFDEKVLKKTIETVQNEKRSMTLRLAAEEEALFIEEKSRAVESPKHDHVEVNTSSGNEDGTPRTTRGTATHKTVENVTEFHWEASFHHSLILFAGNDDSKGVVLGSRTGSTKLVTRMKQEPFHPQKRPPIDLDVTFLFASIDKETLTSAFQIDREKAKTPRRNEQVEEAYTFAKSLSAWSSRSLHYFRHSVRHELLQAYKDSCPADWLQKIDVTEVFAPIVPLFEENEAGEVEAAANDESTQQGGLISLKAPPSGSPILSLKDTNLFLEEQCRSLSNVLKELMSKYPEPSDDDQFITSYEAKLVLLWLHLCELSQQWRRGIEYVEEMLRNQLVDAIGKVVHAKDFNAFLRFHNQRVFPKMYSPKPFCYAIRQPNQYPDGVLSIVSEEKSWSSRPTELEQSHADPIETFSRHMAGDSLSSSISIPLNAATTIEFVGDQYLHGWMDTHFVGQSNAEHFISARARQFSCFLLMTGSISGPAEFTPKDAIILQNKDEVLIPLLTTAMPSAKVFRDAIKSLSPEQARFAKSYRAMQLDSSVFGVCVIQVKPQMEALLDLPPHALTKEIQLTQDLLSLFVEYQIPPNLVSYDGDESATLREKVATVKEYVKGVMDVIKGMKDSQLEEEAKKADTRVEMSTEGAKDRNKKEHHVMRRGMPMVSASYEVAAPKVMSFGGAAAPPASMAAMSMAASTAPDVPVDDGHFVADDYDTLQDHKAELKDGGKQRSDQEWFGKFGPETDFTVIPKKLDALFETYDSDNALRTVTLKTGDNWSRKRQENLLTKLERSVLNADEQKMETNKALDLLDALSRSGSLPIASGELHILVGVRHEFEQNIMSTVIEENINPIEKVDYSSLLMAATVHEVDISTLLINSAEPPKLVLSDRKFPPLMTGNGENDETLENKGAS